MDRAFTTGDSLTITAVHLEVLAGEVALTTTIAVDQAATVSEAEAAMADREAGTTALIPITMADHLHSHVEDQASTSSAT
jgi:hypothetical protein